MFNDYSSYLKNRYGKKVYKLPVNLRVSCPNRDGFRGVGGCTFCGADGAGFEALDCSLAVTEQLAQNRDYMGKAYHAELFIAYLQNFTNTYLPVEEFESVLSDCVCSGIVGISVSTRPDCVHTDYLEAAKRISEKSGVDMIFELGLQSVNTQTLVKINRGHTLAEYVNAVLKIKSYGFSVGTHLIPNLPYDTTNDIIEAAQLVSVLKTDTVKLHNLFLMRGTPLADDFTAGKFSMITKEEYYARVAAFLKNLSPEIAIERFFARCPEEGCVFSNWGRSWRFLQNELMTYLFQNNVVQGSETQYLQGIKRVL